MTRELTFPLLLLALALPASAQATPDPEPLTLARVYAIARAQNPRLRAVRTSGAALPQPSLTLSPPS